MLRPVTFELLADAESGVLPRILMPFARRDLTPDQIRTRRIGSAVHATIVVDAVPGEEVRLIEGNLRQIVGMRRVEVLLRATVRAVA